MVPATTSTDLFFLKKPLSNGGAQGARLADS
jgi:hypothetical protein